MAKVTGFLEHERAEIKSLAPKKRLRNFDEFVLPFPERTLNEQASRCMDCGIPYCHNSCPINNVIPEWNNLVYEKDWKVALDVLHSTNNFPEFTSRICPAPCEAACTLNIDDSPVTIKSIERSIIDKAYENGWLIPEINNNKTHKRVAVVGSGPAGLACSQQLARAGHDVHLFEKNDRIGGLLRYGIPNFKMEKHFIDRRIEQMSKEGVKFKCNVQVGEDFSFKKMLDDFDAIVLACGSEQPRDLVIPGRELKGIHFAMDFLTLQNKICEGDNINLEQEFCAKDKDVVVIGGGDTGSDCIGTSNRQGAKSITQLEILEKPPEKENKWVENSEGKFEIKDSKGIDSEITIKADLVLLAMGFVHPIKDKLINDSGIELDARGNVKANDIDYKTNLKKVFVSGDMRRGQSLVVWAIREGRQVAHNVDKFLMGKTLLPL